MSHRDQPGLGLVEGASSHNLANQSSKPGCGWEKCLHLVPENALNKITSTAIILIFFKNKRHI
jgi:hypothetical protein